MTSRYPFTRIAIEIKHKSGNICLKRPVMSYQGLHITSGFKCRWGCHLVDFFLTKIKITFINPSTAIFMKMREKQPSIYQQRTFKKKTFLIVSPCCVFALVTSYWQSFPSSYSVLHVCFQAFPHIQVPRPSLCRLCNGLRLEVAGKVTGGSLGHESQHPGLKNHHDRPFLKGGRHQISWTPDVLL